MYLYNYEDLSKVRIYCTQVTGSRMHKAEVTEREINSVKPSDALAYSLVSNRLSCSPDLRIIVESALGPGLSISEDQYLLWHCGTELSLESGEVPRPKRRTSSLKEPHSAFVAPHPQPS